ncbi:mannose-1-phosphate guanylyltransferase/mannose-6-phosphate isomerase [Simiduia sp. 21SJ11W-1]|uniref:mannose-1-phosphate guanylyltransferase/mannose-6-phosphate isomerase n=1 Tax=Simiduia sp. 21SJ11W-1 TaxID=2909669 RepID=UPI00209EEA26|nr:mannose-1-phosphate guanylyltransferase/mannose-6-phosphate isomerase [Simiduia sp. 21SJ11W-1]UTA47383.1 mannose-1-phosphate guanylyltransferase/mannose-6-phosphate isomerase [Simiduia sp. 21SJ11W-1]
MAHHIVPVILAGGVGSRLWPLSRSRFPKQCIDLEDCGNSLLQATLKRCSMTTQAPVLLCNEEHRFLIAEQARAIGVTPRSILLEPVGKNTAPAIAVAAWLIAQTEPDAIMLVLPSDHVIDDATQFAEKVAQGADVASTGDLVTFGIEPSAPETGYGYIRARTGAPVAAVAEFVEKPDLARAKAYLADGNYLWNSGMFMFRADAYLRELAAFEPEIHALSQAALEQAEADLTFTRLAPEPFTRLPSISIDYAVMERTERAQVVRFPSIWNDVGSWSAMRELGEPDAQNNVTRGDALLLDSKNTLVHAGSRLVAAVGVEDLIIVETDDAVMVTRADRAQDVKKIVDHLAREGRPEVDWHREVHRPWGKYHGLVINGRYQVKRITVNPGQKLSTQMHYHRAEHWVVVSGTAKVRVGEREQLISENESTYIPIGDVHSLENPGKIPLELIEIQTGGYLGEDDIVRFDDRYGRS